MTTVNISPEAVGEALAGLLGGAQNVEALKALTSAGLGSMGIVPENVEMEAHNWLFGAEHFRYIRRVPTVTAKQKLHEFNAVVGIGGSLRGGGFFTPEASGAKDRSYKTKRLGNHAAIIQHRNTVSGTSRATQQFSTLGSTDPFLTNRAAVFLFHHAAKTVLHVYARRAAFRGDIRFKGLFELHDEIHVNPQKFATRTNYADPDFVVDKRGKKLTVDDLERANVTVPQRGFGALTDLYCAPHVAKILNDEVKSQSQRFMPVLNQEKKAHKIGAPVFTIATGAGDIEIYPEQWFHPEHVYAEFEGEYDQLAPKRPAAPATAVVGAGVDVASKWEAVDIPGAPGIKFKLQPENKDGVGQASLATAAVAIVEDGAVDLTWNSEFDADCYHVLRNSVDDPNTYYEIGQVSNTGAVLTFRDRNWKIPGTYDAFACQMSSVKTPGGRILANSDETAVREAVLREKKMEMLGKYGDLDAEFLVEEACPELVFPYRFVRWENIGGRP